MYTYGYLHTRYEYMEAGAYQPYEAIACPQCARKREIEKASRLTLEQLRQWFRYNGDIPSCEYCHKSIGQNAWKRYCKDRHKSIIPIAWGVDEDGTPED